MKYLRQFSIILFISLLGEIIKYLVPLPIPASIYGMVIMLVCLLTKVVKLSSVKDVGKFLIDIMPVMFIPAGVGLITSWSVLKPIIIPVALVTIICILTVMVATGLSSQWIIRRGKHNE